MKVISGIIKGGNPPSHLLKAYGRHIFRLMHISGSWNRKPGLYLRDLPLSIMDLNHDYHRPEAWEAYLAECDRAGIAQSERIGHS